MRRSHKRAPSTCREGVTSIGPHDLRRIGSWVAYAPAPSFHLRDEFRQMIIEQRRFFEVQRVPRLRKNGEPAGGNRFLEEDAGLKAMVVFVADHHEHGRAKGSELAFKIVERGALHLDAAHSVCRAAIGMLCEPIGEQLPTPRILLLELNPRRTFRIGFRKRLRTLCFEVARDLRRYALEIILARFLGAITSSRRGQRKDAIGIAQAGMQDSKDSHRYAYEVRLIDARGRYNIDDVVGGARLRIGFYIVGTIGRRKTSSRIGHAAMPPREEIHLRLPAPVVTAELVHEDYRRTASRRVIEQSDAV